jgi:MFS transporter, OFA family, oxalate/formate antiporter
LLLNSFFSHSIELERRIAAYQACSPSFSPATKSFHVTSFLVVSAPHPKSHRRKSMTRRRTGFVAVTAASIAIFWPGALIFGLPGVMATRWAEMFHVGRGAIGNILFFVLAAVGLFMFFVGSIQEEFGSRRMVIIGATMTGLSVPIIAFSPNIFGIYLWAFLTGAASCFVYIPALTIVQKWYPSRRGLVSGIVNFAFGASAALAAPVFGFMSASLGYAPMLFAIAVAALVVGVPAALLTGSPKSQSAPLPVSVPAPITILAPSLTVAQSIRTKSFWFLWLTWAFQGAAGISMVTLSTTFGVSKGFTLETAVVILTAFNTTNGFGRLIAGALSDVIGRNLTMSSTFFAAGCAYLILPQVSGLAAVAGLAAVIGFAFGALFGVSGPLATDCFGLKHFGTVFGLVFTAYGFVAGLIGPSLSGYLLDATSGDFLYVFGYLGTFCLLSAVFIQFVRPPGVLAIRTR